MLKTSRLLVWSPIQGLFWFGCPKGKRFKLCNCSNGYSIYTDYPDEFLAVNQNAEFKEFARQGKDIRVAQ